MGNFFSVENIFLIVGATNDTEKFGSRVFLDLKDAGYNVIAINKHGGEVFATPAYVSVSAFLKRVKELFNEKKVAETIPKIVLVFVIPPEAALEVLQEAVALGVKKAWFQPGAESEAAIVYCKEQGIEETHDACIMVEKPAR